MPSSAPLSPQEAVRIATETAKLFEQCSNGPFASKNDALRAASIRFLLASSLAWEQYALHVEGCVECAQMSWRQCWECRTLRGAAFGETYNESGEVVAALTETGETT